MAGQGSASRAGDKGGVGVHGATPCVRQSGRAREEGAGVQTREFYLFI